MSDRKSPWLADKRSKKRMKELYQAEKDLHSLRLAVLEFINGLSKYEHDGRDEMYVHFNDHKDLALSAGIHFENGQWKLKEGEE